MTNSNPPTRPRYRAAVEVLDRGPDTLQIGLDPRRAMVASGLSEPVAEAARSLTGGHTDQELLARVGPDNEADLRALISALDQHGILEDAAGPAPPIPRHLIADETAAAVRTRLPTPEHRTTAAVTIHGNGRLAVAVAIGLAAAGVGLVRAESTGQVTADDTGTGLTRADIGSRGQDAIHAALRRTDETVRTHRPSRRHLTLAVLTDAHVPDPGVVADLFALGVPHLPVHIQDGIGVVGPLVLPGATSCLACANHRRLDRDPAWPRVAAQLVARPLLADLPTTQATAGLAVTQALAALRHLHAPGQLLPTVWNRTLELDPVEGAIEQRPAPPHPRCPCLARRIPPPAQADEWERGGPPTLTNTTP